jgi:hypothetical protein
MSQPVWTSLEPPTISGTTLGVGRGDWRAGGDLGELTLPKWRAWIVVDGRTVHGGPPGMPSVPASVVYPDEISWNSRLQFDLTPWADGKPHQLEVYRFAAQFFQGWGDHPNSAWEWGYYSAADLTSPAAWSTKFTFGAPIPAPPPPPSPDALYAPSEAKRNIVAEVEKYRQGRADTLVAGTRLYFIELLALDRDDARWRRIGPQLFALLRL